MSTTKELKDIYNNLNTAFSEFRQTYDARHEDFDKDLKNLVDRLDNLELDGQSRGLGSNTGFSDDPQARKYHDSFMSYLIKGRDGISSDMMNSLSVGSAPDGGFWVPSTISEKIIQKLHETSNIRKVAAVVTIPTDRYEMPKDVDEFESGGWVGEVESRSETDSAEVGIHEIPLHEQYAMPKTTQKVLDMGGYVDIESWLVAKITNKLRRTENTAFVSGNGVAKPRGFTDYTTAATDDDSRAWGILQHVVSGSDGGFKAAGSGPANCLFDLTFSIKDDYLDNAVWMMKRQILAEVAKLRDSNDNYVLSVSSGLTGEIRSPFQLMGFPVLMAQDMPAHSGTDNLAIAFGDFGEGYQIVDHSKGLSVLRDPFTSKPWVKFYSTKYTGGDVINFDAIKFLKMSAS